MINSSILFFFLIEVEIDAEKGKITYIQMHRGRANT